MKKMAAIFTTMWMLLLAGLPAAYGQSQETRKGELQQPAESKKGVQPLDIVLVLDNSGSMIKNDPNFLTRQVVSNFVGGLDEQSRLGMVIFDQEAVLACPLTSLRTQQDKELFLKNLERVNYKGQFTNSPAGIERAIYELKTRARKDAERVIIFLTDGIVDTGDKAVDLEKERWLKEDLARESSLEAIRIFGVAFTDAADFRLIQTLALKTGGEYFRAFKAEDIQDVFQKITAAITTPSPKPEIAAPAAPKQTIALQARQAPSVPQSPSNAGDAVPPPKEKVFSPLTVGGGAALLAVLGLFLLLRKKPGPAAGEMRPDVQKPRQTAPMPKAQLIDESQRLFEKPRELTKQSLAIGRDPNNDIVIAKETVSSLHATIDYKNGYFILEDQRSSNGTKLNGRPLEAGKAMRLKSGDRIQFDIYELTFLIPGHAPQGATVLTAGGASRSGSATEFRSSGGSSAGEAQASPREMTPASGGSDQEPEPKNNGPEKDDKTWLKPVMCPNHASWKATELCANSHKAFCKKCMTEKNGMDLCPECAKSV